MIKYHWELEVYQLSVEAAMRIFKLTKSFPKKEIYSLTDQIRRSSRSVSGQIAEAWRRRKYEAAETQVWLEYSMKCNYIKRDIGKDLHKIYDTIIGKLVTMGNNPKRWILKKSND